MSEESPKKNKSVKLVVLKKTSNNFIPKINILFSYIEKLLPSMITCHGHFQGIITGVKKKKNLCFEFLSIFP